MTGARTYNAEFESIAAEAELRAHAFESERLTLVTQQRTLQERRRSLGWMTAVAIVAAFVCTRLRGTVGSLALSVSSMLALWGCVDLFRFSNQIGVFRQRQRELIEVRDAARALAEEARRVDRG